jgi:putative transcriptional regulator
MEWVRSMRNALSHPANLTGSLLVALPALIDPNFRRTILFLMRHDPSEGAMGVILNRPTASLLPEVDPDIPEELGNVSIYEGGPVETQQLILAKMIQIDGGTGATSFEALGREDCTPLLDLGKGDFRAFVGYAGWGKGQLEREIAEKSWIVTPPTPDLLTPPLSREAGEAQWRRLMRKQGPWNHLMSGAPDDLSLN